MGRKYISARATEKQYLIWKKLPYHKKDIITSFLQKYSNEFDKYIKKFNQLKNYPQSILPKRTILAPKGIAKEELEAFLGFIQTCIEEKKDVDEILKELL